MAVRYRLLPPLFALLSLLAPNPVAQAGEATRWLKKPVAFQADKYPLDRLLAVFAARQGIGAKVSPRLAGVVSGDVVFSNPREFLDVISRTQMLKWYFDGSSVHFFPIDEMHSRLFALDGASHVALRESLEVLGLYDEQYEWRVTENGNILKVQGPDVYLDQVANILDQEKTALRARKDEVRAERREKKLQVIRLSHAWADDRTIVTSNSSSVKVPGVAALLRQILQQQYALAPPPVLPPPLGASTLHRGTGAVARRNEPAGADPLPQSPSPVSASDMDSDSLPFVQSDPRLNAVLVWDIEENHARNLGIVQKLDQPLAMVEIRAAVVEVEANRTRDLGISFEARDGSGNWKNSAGSNSSANDDFLSIKGDGLNFTTIYSHGLDNLMLRVKAIEEEGAAEVLSRPSVLTQDNIQAVLEQTETFYVKLEGYEQVDMADIQTGMTLRVTPHIISDDPGEIQLSVYLTMGADSGSGAETADYLPRVHQSSISTQAVIHEGEALVIGGYYNERRTKGESGVPFLRKIPGLGALFRTRLKSHSKVERLFVLSPRIIYPGNSMMNVGSKAEYVMEHSPERDALNEPKATSSESGLL